MYAKLLLIEDDLNQLATYKTALENSGFDVWTATTGEDGLKIALENHPGLILVDIGLPKMDGITVMKILRENEWGKTVPIILLTNLNPSDKILNNISAVNPAYYLVKANVPIPELIEKINDVLESPLKGTE